MARGNGLPTQDPEPAHARQTPPAGQIDLIELISSHGSAADPAEAELLGALSRLQRVILPEVRLLRERGKTFLSAPLFEQIDRSARSLPAAAAVRLSDLPVAARKEIGQWIERHRATLMSDLKTWAPAMEFTRLSYLLEQVWGTEKVSESTAGFIGSAEVLAETGRQLDEIRSSAGSALAEQGGRETPRINEDEWLKTCAQLEESCAAARQNLAAKPGDDSPSPHPLLKSAAEAASRALARATASTHNADMESWQPVLASWDATLRALLSGGSATIAEGQRSRQELAEMLQHNIARHVALDLGLQDQSRKLPTGDIDGTAKTLLASATSGGSSFQEAFEKALSLARKVKGRSDARLKETSSRLRTATKAMETFLENAADHLPAARVVAARLWLEQSEGVVASGEIPSMDAMTQSLADDLKELNVLIELSRKRRQGKEAGERETLKADAARYLKAATGAIAGKLQPLVDAIDKTDPKGLAPLRAGIETLGTSVEQSVRLSAGTALAGARRLLPRADKAGTAKLSDKLRNIEELSVSLKTAGEKDDLARIGTLARELGAAVAAAAPLSRPVVRAGIAALGIVVTAGGFIAWRSMSNRPAVYRLKLAGTEQQSASVLLVRDGKPYRPAEARKGSDVVEIALPEGRYEIFINDRYTGRVVQVPGPVEIDEIPVP